MKIINQYTGNPMINNALMTIKALAGLSSISELTTEILKGLILRVDQNKTYSLMDLNLRFKSYTMLFTTNSLLCQPQCSKDTRLKTYQKLILHIIDGFENDGEYLCDISGLKYTKKFSDLFKEVLEELKVPKKDIEKKDLTINRCWFPLLGGLGSDAQALPMAKFTYNIHPIFIVVLQFLPLSALIYKRGILLVDSSDIGFCEEYVAFNTQVVQERVQSVSLIDSIENVKDFSKGSYLINALSIMGRMELEGQYIDLNLWSFSNSGAGASCEIDRLPNSLLMKLRQLYVRRRLEVETILNNRALASGFIDCLDGCSDWGGLYPTKKYEGVSIAFFEAYWDVVGANRQLDFAKYIAYLIFNYKSKSFDEYLDKTDADRNSNYTTDLNVVLIAATKDGKWSFAHQLSILTDKESIPVKSGYGHLLKLIHFYYQKQVFSSVLPEPYKGSEAAIVAAKWIAQLVEKDNRVNVWKNLTSSQNYTNVSLEEVLIRQSLEEQVDVNRVFSLLYNEYGESRSYGLLSLLRFYSVEPSHMLDWEEEDILQLSHLKPPVDFDRWFRKIEQFVEDYLEYRCEKVAEDNRSNYILKIIKGIPDSPWRKMWFDDIFERLHQYRKKNQKQPWDKEILLYDPMGNYRFTMTMWVVRMHMYKVMYAWSRRKNENLNL